MISGVELGKGKGSTSGVEVLVASNKDGKLAIWLDDLRNGRMIASIPIPATGSQNNWKKLTKMFTNISGRHDVFVKFLKAMMLDMYIGSIRF
jgi:xylan 1,4-beta-xylosidase